MEKNGVTREEDHKRSNIKSVTASISRRTAKRVPNRSPAKRTNMESYRMNGS